ncbi:MAG: hypothetical protein NTV09_04265 [Bacteroidetes bacterium]|nr:hypothetical protein [Bacteroidota bacterium]
MSSGVSVFLCIGTGATKKCECCNIFQELCNSDHLTIANFVPMIKKKIMSTAQRKIKSPVKAKAKIIAKKKSKPATKGKTKITAKNKKEIPAKRKAKVVVPKKSKTPARVKAKLAVKKKIKTPARRKATNTKAVQPKISVRKKAEVIGSKKIKKAAVKTTGVTDKEKFQLDGTITQNPVTAPPQTGVVTLGDDLHFIPGKGETHPVNTLEAHQIEINLHHHEEVAMHQENQKMKQAMASRKNAKRNYRITGRR